MTSPGSTAPETAPVRPDWIDLDLVFRDMRDMIEPARISHLSVMAEGRTADQIAIDELSWLLIAALSAWRRRLYGDLDPHRMTGINGQGEPRQVMAGLALLLVNTAESIRPGHLPAEGPQEAQQRVLWWLSRIGRLAVQFAEFDFLNIDYERGQDGRLQRAAPMFDPARTPGGVA